MQNKGIVILVAVLLTLASIFYLSFSVAVSYYDSEAAQIKDPIAQQDYKDSVKYLGIYPYSKCLESQIGLGLDLKGGMNVILEVSVPDVIDVLADHSKDANYVKAMEQAKKEQETSQSDFLSLFINDYKKLAGDNKLSVVFATQQLKGKVSTQSTDSEIESVLKQEIESAVDNSFNVVRNRIDKFGVVQPNIQKLEGQQGRIMVEMPGVSEPERIRKLLQGSANLEFWETYSANEVYPYLRQLNQRIADDNSGKKPETQADTTSAAKKDVAAKDTKKEDSAASSKFTKTQGQQAATASKNAKQAANDEKTNPLFSHLQAIPQGLSLVGYANIRDTAAINKIIYSQAAKEILPRDLKLLWSAKPEDGIQAKNIYGLYALKITTSDGKAPIEGDVITDAKDEFDQMGKACVSMQMNADGASKWAELTKNNIGKAVAIVLDDAVYSAPRVNQEIDGGNSSISGNFTVQDTKDLANTLKSGRMPAPARIVSAEVVGPSLGQKSIEQGLWSFVIAFIILMIYMILMYNFIPGMMANIALLFNLFFTMGILASFQSALTMPGIAGIVLTLGTAVDANVLIYERTKEEMRKGLNIKQALSAGYSNAFSAIFDSNITSLITGIILLTIGTGPIKGFATTWIIGIICSFFTAVFLTRLVYENRMAKDKWLHLTFMTPLSKNLLQNTHVHFISIYKSSFTIYGIVIIAFIASFAIRGLSPSIDFTGGRNYVVKFDKQVEPEEVRDIIKNAFPNCNTGALAIGTDGNQIRISTNYKIESNDPNIDDEAEAILFKALKSKNLITQNDVEKFKNPNIQEGGSIISSTKVGPSVAKDITHGAIIAVIVALIAIFLYILLRFRNVAFSVGSIVALAVDTLVVIGFYSALYDFVPFSLEIDQTFIGAILTVIGYSINDKVVVFDRIRENLKLHKKQDYQITFNDSINQTLARTVNTSVSTLIVLLCIFILGGDSIRSFSFAMILGVVFGTLSSIFIAAPTAYLTLGRKVKDLRKEDTEAMRDNN